MILPDDLWVVLLYGKCLVRVTCTPGALCCSQVPTINRYFSQYLPGTDGTDVLEIKDHPGTSSVNITQYSTYHPALLPPVQSPPNPSLPLSPSSWTVPVGFRRYYSVPGCGLVSGHWDKCLWMNFTQYWVNTSIDTKGRGWWKTIRSKSMSFLDVNIPHTNNKTSSCEMCNLFPHNSIWHVFQEKLFLKTSHWSDRPHVSEFFQTALAPESHSSCDLHSNNIIDPFLNDATNVTLLLNSVTTVQLIFDVILLLNYTLSVCACVLFTQNFYSCVLLLKTIVPMSCS